MKTTQLDCSAPRPARSSSIAFFRTLAACLIVAIFVSAGPVFADEPAAEPEAAEAKDPAFRGWAFSVGQFDYLDDDHRTGEAGIEYRFRPIYIKKFFKWKNIPLIPTAGFSATSDEGYWGYAGFRFDWNISEHWIVTPGFAAGLYEQGDGKDLGGPVQFRSSIEIARQFSRNSRLGLQLYHLSNSRLYDLNPGSETLMLVWSLGR